VIWRFFDTAAQCLEHVGGYLERRDAENNLALGILYSLVDGRTGSILRAKPLLGMVENNGRPMLVFVMTPPMQMVIASVEAGPVPREAIQTAVASLTASGASVPGVVGEPEIANAFAEYWGIKHGCSSEIVMNQRIYRLDQVNEIRRGSGRLRNAVEADAELVANWIREFSIDVGEPMPYEMAARKARANIAERSLYVLALDDGEPVSMAKKSRSTRLGVVVSLVYTPPALRGKGYATMCVASLSQLLLDQGYRFCSLYTDLANPTSNHIYQTIGYRPVQDSVALRFNERCGTAPSAV